VAPCGPYTTRGSKTSATVISSGSSVPRAGHDEMIPPIGLLQGWRLPPCMRVLDLQSRFRCRECDARGKVVLSIKWAVG
jgi:hypothetical protein